MTNVIHIIIGVSALSILVGSIFLYFRWKSIKALNNLNRKAMCIHIPDFIDPNPDILPTWQGKLRYQYQLKKMFSDIFNVLWSTKDSIEHGIEQYLENLGLIDENLFLSNHNDNIEDENEIEIYSSDEKEGAIGDKDYDVKDGGEVDFNPQGIIVSSSDSTFVVDNDNVPNILFSINKSEKEIKKSSEMKKKARIGMHAKTNFKDGVTKKVNYGRLCMGNRIDYSLQEKEIEITNEYIFAVGAHVLYWASKDLANFIAERTSDANRPTSDEEVPHMSD